eukprot:Gb_02809 [translate_table: standard]
MPIKEIVEDSFVDGVATRDVVVDKETGVWVRIYLPQTVQNSAGEPKLPVAVHFHGGGFCVSHADWGMYYYFYARLVKESGMMCVSVEYRLAPEHRLPAACEDCFGVVRWLRSVALGEAQEPWLARYADFSRCVLMGESAGGNLVLQTALRAVAQSVDPVCLGGCVVLHPGFVREQRSKSEVDTPDSPFLTVEILDKLLRLALPIESTKDHPIINPMGPHAPSLRGIKLPKMLLAIAGKDLMRDTQLEFFQVMKAAGQNVELFISEDVSHYFHVNVIANKANQNSADQTAKLLTAVTRFIGKC